MKKKKKQLLTLVVVLSALLSVWQVGPINAEGPPPPEPPQPGSITAHKFHDGNGNGVQDAGEEDLPGWPMRIYRWDQSPVLVAEGSTNDSGAVTFDGLEPGRYKVWEADQECWQPTTPGGNHWNGGYYQVVHLAEGESVTVQFGNVYTCEPSPPPPPETCIDLEKTGPETANPGETITYHFWVHNCGELVLHGGAQVYDPLFGDAPIWDGDLEPGEIHEFDMAYTLLDDHCGNFTNNAWAVGHPPEYPEVRDDDSWTVVVICEPQPNPSIDVEKYVSVDDQATWHDADTPPGPEAIAGSETVWFRFVVTNDGDATLTGVTLSDTDFNAEIASQCTVPTSLAPGESFTCLIGPFVAIEGQHMNTGTTTGNYEGQPYSDTDRAKYYGYFVAAPSIGVEKTADPTSVSEPGGSVTFDVVVNNTGDRIVTLTTLVDDIHGDLNGQGTCSLPQDIAIGGFYACAFSADVTGNAGDSETDVVTASGNDDDGNPVSDDDDATVTVTDSPSSIQVTKTADPDEVAEPGGLVNFTVRVNNHSTVDSVTATVTH